MDFVLQRVNVSFVYNLGHVDISCNLLILEKNIYRIHNVCYVN
jgi:hypothetical protein